MIVARSMLFVLPAIAATAVAAAGSFILFQGATDAEQRELNAIGGGYYRASFAGSSGIIAFCDRVLAANPANKVAGRLRAWNLLQVGRAAECAAELADLRVRYPDYPEPLECQFWLSLAIGNKKEAIARLHERSRFFADHPAARGRTPAPREGGWYAEKALELEGRWEEIQKRIAERSKSDDRFLAAYAVEEMGGLYLRRGMYADAEKYLDRAATASRERDKNSPALVAAPLISLAHAQWARGQRDRALASALDAVRWASMPNSSPHLRAESLLIAHALCTHGIGTPAERRLVGELLRESAQKFPKANEYSLMNVARCLAGESSYSESVKRVKAVLRAAPHVDWAVWAALYLSLASPDGDAELAALLPDGSLQRRLYIAAH
ncbi:MAG TPA: hypothetical protein VIK18_06285 [Pirellulales bacterium]